MNSPYGTVGLSDIEEDIAATHQGQARIASFFPHAAESARPIRTRGGPLGLARTPLLRSAHDLVARCAEETQKRCRTLLHFEANFPEGGDHGFLIGPACQIVEAELDRLLSGPAERVAGHLAEALKSQRKDRGLAEVLEKWASKGLPTTLGVQVGVLVALQRGCEQRIEGIEDFLASRFQARYVELLASKKLATCLDIVRRDFRNPVSHGQATFDAAQYQTFTRLVFAQKQVAAWVEQGPEPAEPDADVGVFHHHLALARLPMH
jgi:hypothetical protein